MSEVTLVSTSTTRPLLRFERHLESPPEVVWRAVTDLKEMSSWFPTRIEMDHWENGSKIVHHFAGHDIEPIPGTVLEWDPPHRVSFTWGADTITFEVTRLPEGGTLFVLSEQLDANHVARNAAGWDGCLDRLEYGTEHEAWSTRFERYVTRFEPILGQQVGPPKGITSET